tara:strand:- start:1005318 stop:1005671 length:354 start_codon:yes stop_codon:yes gene_type:complete
MEIRPLHLYLYGPDGGPIPTSFEDVSQRLCELGHLYFEPDGSFAWSPTRDEALFGMVYDAAGQVQYVELRGHCSHRVWRQVVCAVCGPSTVEMTVMCLRTRRMKEVQSFEESTWVPA